ncbi:MAG: hypothetical protein JSW02_10620 [candidate division WOR-3 bacterium]|nr:MAG: hypothetical protein JSW02_10620 [candidate division WOR-3 bacterium]
MKYISIAFIGLFALIAAGALLAHGGDYHHGGTGMMGHHMMGYDWDDDAHHSGTMGMGISADYLLDYKNEIDLSKTQVAKLKKIRDSYEKDVVSLRANWEMVMAELHNLLSEDELNTGKIMMAKERLSEIESELHSKNIETYTSAKMLLTRDQLRMVEQMGVFDMHVTHRCHD